jgi:hypothetical protein
MKYNPYEPPPIGAAVIKTILQVTNKHGNIRCRPSEGRILELLSKFHGINICRQTLSHWISFLSHEHYLFRKQYLYRDENGQWRFGANTYYLLPRAYKYLRTLVGWAKKAFKLYRVVYSRHYERPTDLNKFLVESLAPVFRPFIEEKGRASPIKGIL